MSKKLNMKPPDPLLPYATAVINGKTYKVCLEIGALARAKADLRANGIKVNILFSLDFDDMDVDVIPAVFYASLREFHPEVTMEEAFALVTMKTITIIFKALAEAFQKAMAPEGEKPSVPPEEPGS